MKKLKAYRYRLYPNKEQKEYFAKCFGVCRFVYNSVLDYKINAYKNGIKYSCYDAIKDFTQIKKIDGYEWLKDINAQVIQQSILHLDNAFQKFFKEKSFGFPKFKRKQNKQSFSMPQNCKVKGNKLYIPKVKKGINIKLHRFLIGKIKTVTISKTPTGKYFASVLGETEENEVSKSTIKEETTIGIDLGIKEFAILSTGEKINNPKYIKNKILKIKRQQRRLSKKVKGSSNRNKQRHKVAVLHEKVTNQRKDFLHKLSSRLISENQTICIEDLAVKNMIKNHKLSQAISDVGWGEFRRHLTYKSDWYGNNLIVVDRFQPSSKKCSSCGSVKRDLTLADREWTCDCGTRHDRDINAAINIKNFGLTKSIGQGLPKYKPVEKCNFQLTSMKQEASELKTQM